MTPVPLTPRRDLRRVLRDDALYLGDGGRIVCGAHAGMSAAFTGHDLHGAPCLELTGRVLDALLADLDGDESLIRCESPRCACGPKRVVLP